MLFSACLFRGIGPDVRPIILMAARAVPPCRSSRPQTLRVPEMSEWRSVHKADQGAGQEVQVTVYDLSNDHDRLRLAVSLMHREQRIEFVKRIKARYGVGAEQNLKNGLRREFQARNP